MRIFRSARLMLLALLVCLIPATSSAGVFISVGFAPPVLPVYVQPPCPEDGWLWTPGYWAYGDDGYYWVPGTWVPAPYEGALWTPGYWGWGSGLYVWHPGYWGRHVGYYGGVNYGFGYMGVGFVGGMWAGGAFRYNTAVMHVNRTVIHNTYEDNTIVRNNTVVNDRHVAFSGGPGGINHPPTADETRFSHEQHMAPTSFQTQHEGAARTNVQNYASHNGGHPANVATARPMTANAHGSPSGGGHDNAPPSNPGNRNMQPENRRGGMNPQPGNSHGGANPQYEGGHSNQMAHQNGAGNQGGQPQPQFQAHQQPHQQPQMHESRPAPQPQMHESHNPPPPHNNPPPPHNGGGNQGHEREHGH